MSRLEKLLKGGTVQLSHDDIEDVVEKFPQMSEANYKKLAKAYRLGKGVRFSLQEDELQGSGFKSMAKKGAKSALKNKQLSKLKDQAINKGLNIVADEIGLEGDAKSIVKGLAKQGINSQIDEFAGSGMNKKLGKKILKTAVKGLKTSNKISNALGYDDLDDMAIDFATQQTLGRVDPTGGIATKLVEKELNKLADNKMEKMSGNGIGRSRHAINPHDMPRDGKVHTEFSKRDTSNDVPEYTSILPSNKKATKVKSIGASRAYYESKKNAESVDSESANKYKKMNGGSMSNPYLPSQLRGGAIKVYNDKSNLVHSHHPAYKPSPLLDPQFDRLKLLQQQQNY